MVAAVHFSRQANVAPDGLIYGRYTATDGFLTAFARHAGEDGAALGCVAPAEDDARALAALLGGAGIDRPVAWLPERAPARLADAGTMIKYDPELARFAWLRRGTGTSSRHSLLGITHTTASAPILQALSEWLVAPFEPWDALICTSRAAAAQVRAHLDSWIAYLGERCGQAPALRPALPVIPLGIDAASFDPLTNAAGVARTRWRQRLGIGDDDIAVLFMGRLNPYSKAHPYPSYVALEHAAARTGRTVHLIEAGWFATAELEAGYARAAEALAPHVRRHVIDARGADARREIWHAADLFLSLADNIQETFGLTPVEAMAAGMPVVASDWNGYRDTVAHETTGFLVPTVAPPAGIGEPFACDYLLNPNADGYQRHIAAASQLTVVDVKRATDALAALIGDNARRADMGRQARRRELDLYDWPVVIATYRDLLSDMMDIRTRAGSPAGRAATGTMPHAPAQPDPFALFAAYPSAVVAWTWHLIVVPDWSDRLATLLQLGLVTAAAGQLLTMPEIENLLAAGVRADRGTLAQLCRTIPAERRDRLLRTACWLAKFDLARLEPPVTGGA
jgi:glycosyltransferase involved in cell wall biosynthesis